MVSHQNSGCGMCFLTKSTFSERLYEDFKLIVVSNHRLDSSNTIADFPNMANRNISKMKEGIRKTYQYRHSITVPRACLCGRMIGQFFFFGKILRAICGTPSSLFAMKILK